MKMNIDLLMIRVILFRTHFINNLKVKMTPKNYIINNSLKNNISRVLNFIRIYLDYSQTFKCISS